MKEVVVIDENIILYAVQQFSKQCRDFLSRCVNEEINGILPSHILAEIMHHLMIAEASENGWIKEAKPAKQMMKRPEIVKKLVRYKEIMLNLLNIALRIEHCFILILLMRLIFKKVLDF